MKRGRSLRSLKSARSASGAQFTGIGELFGALNSNVSAAIATFIAGDAATLGVMLGVSSAWRAAAQQLARVVPAGKHTGGLTTFAGLATLDAADRDDVTDVMLREAGTAWPALTSVDFSGCQNFSSLGVRALVKGLGVRLTSYSQNVTPRHSTCKEMRVTPAVVGALAGAAGLVDLSLTLSSKFHATDLSSLAGHASLRRLSLFFEGFYHVDIPGPLPRLERARLHTGNWSTFNWNRAFVNAVPSPVSQWPMLSALVINDHSGDSDFGHSAPLSLDSLEQLCLRLPAMTAADGLGELTIEHLGRHGGVTCGLLQAQEGALATAGIRVVDALSARGNTAFFPW